MSQNEELPMQTAEVINFNGHTADDPKCAFCKIPKSKAKAMFKSNNQEKHICGECVARCRELMGLSAK